MSSIWLALEIGNSRLHWGWFAGEDLQATWDTPHLSTSIEQQLAQDKTLTDLPEEILSATPINLKSKIQNLKLLPPLYIASVVPSQTALWIAYPDVHVITLDKVPLLGVYPTLGIDRALSVLGAGETFGFPILVIDAGTALTFTGADRDRCLVGGAISPGLRLQLQSLGQQTANLPLIATPEILALPERWALNTPEAIQSGVIYTLIASIRDFITAWWEKFPDSQICFKGGDGKLLLEYLRSLDPQLVRAHSCATLLYEPNLTFWGMRSYLQNLK
jgi:type III pantothenate kinase